MEFKKYKLKELCSSISTRGHQIKQTEIISSGKNPVISQSDSFIEGYSNKEIALNIGPCVIFGDHTCIVKYVNFPFIIGADGVKVLQSSVCDPYYFYCIVKCLGELVSDGKYRRHFYDLNEKEISLPSLGEQKKIAGTLALIDRKIELCEAQNRTLEKLARQIYDYWFVQFDFPDENGRPYKSSGGKMIYNEKLKRQIPEGWEVKSVGEVADVKKGELITESIATEGRVKVVAAGIDYSYFHGVSNREKNTITISGSGANAGFIRLWLEPIFASDCTTVRGETDVDTFFLFFHLFSLQDSIYRCFRDSGSSAQPHVYPNDIKSIFVASIPNKLKDQIGSILCDAYESIALNQKQIQTLVSLRERLLPLLMNGQAEVRD